MDVRLSPDNRRLLKSALAALALHAALFVPLALAVSGAPQRERPGMLTLNLETFTPGPAASSRTARDDPRPSPAPSAKPSVDPKKSAMKGAAEGTKSDAVAIAAADKARPAKEAVAKDKDGTPRDRASPGNNGAAASRLERGSLDRLDRALAAARDACETAGGGNGGESGSNATWEDRAERELLSRTNPVIPRWVSEQGLRLKVELSVELDADGLVTVRAVRVSSGYPDVDAAVAGAVSRWKYSSGAGAKIVRGTVVYFIELR